MDRIHGQFKQAPVESEEKSKSQFKREAHALQRLGEQLVELSKDQLAGMDIPDKLRDAVLAAKTMPSHGARRRQLQFIGSLMRTLDPAPVEEAVDRISLGRVMARNAFKKVETYRDELLRDDGAVETFITDFPVTDRQKLRQLVRNASKEMDLNKPGQSYRNLFRYLREILEYKEP
ncbi:MAG: ribosome biogenesis factor YjgA [Pseudomonadota bacterium]